MPSYQIYATKAVHRYPAKAEPAYEGFAIDADTFKVNDQGTVVFSTSAGNAVAAFKNWTTIEVVR